MFAECLNVCSKFLNHKNNSVLNSVGSEQSGRSAQRTSKGVVTHSVRTKPYAIFREYNNHNNNGKYVQRVYSVRKKSAFSVAFH